jgi:hypothetical protein
MKYFYKMEKNWGFTGSAEADTADQDQDKSKTYDMCRLEYAHVDSILYIGISCCNRVPSFVTPMSNAFGVFRLGRVLLLSSSWTECSSSTPISTAHHARLLGVGH